MRGHRALVLTVATVAALALSMVTAYAGATNQWIDDTCNHGGAVQGYPWFFADGPSQYWWPVTYSGGLDSCMMYTWNESTYTNIQTGNSAYWYLDTGSVCGGNCDGYYVTYVFIPNVHAYTKNAVYQLWTTGHAGGDQYNCSVDQSALNNQWKVLCAGSSGGTNHYFCGDTIGSGCGGYIWMNDGTGETSGTKQVGYDYEAYCATGGCP